MITNLTTKQIESIQIDEGVIFLDYGETTERLLAPTRGGGEFAATVTGGYPGYRGAGRVNQGNYARYEPGKPRNRYSLLHSRKQRRKDD